MSVSSAWGDDYTTVYSRASVGDWTNDDKTDWNASSAVEISSTNGIGANANLTATYITKSFNIGAKNKVKYEVDWTFATATGREGNWNWIQFGNFLRIAINSTYNMQVSTDAGATWNATALGYYKNGTYTKKIEVVFNTSSQTIESFSFDGTDRTALVSGTFSGNTFNTVSTGFVRGGSVSWTLNNYLTTFTVSEAEPPSDLENYTINYKDGETILKTISASASPGTVIPVETYFWKDNVKYKKNDGEPESLTVATGGSTLDVAVSEAAYYNYIVKTSTNVTLASGSYYEQEPVTVSYRAFYLDGRKLYRVDKYDDSKKQYRATFTLDSDNKEITINATKVADNVYYYSEGEDVNGATPTNAGNNMAARSSNAQCGYTDNDLTLTQLPAGNYTATIVSYSNSSAGYTMIFSFADEYEQVISGANNWAETTHNFTLTGITDIKWLASGNTKNGLDLIYITGTPDHEIVGAIDKSTEYATSDAFTLKKGETKKLTFQNYGQDFAKNWRINVIENNVWKSVTRADSWDETANAATKVAYKVSKDGGNTIENLDWSEFTTDMADAYVVATLAYGLDGTLAITTTSTGSASGYIYYVDQDVTGLTGDLEIQLAVNYSWLEILSVEQVATPATIAASGWSTLATPYGLDFSAVDGLTAFAVTNITDNTVYLTSVDEMPANNGVVLKGTASTAYSIPVKAEATFTGTNKLHAAVTAYDCAANEVYIMQGGLFHLVTAASTVPAGKAYLLAEDVPSNVKQLGFLFDEGTTAIEGIESRATMNGQFYNMAGQRVNVPTRGIYIVNGKKVFIK